MPRDDEGYVAFLRRPFAGITTDNEYYPRKVMLAWRNAGISVIAANTAVWGERNSATIDR